MQNTGALAGRNSCWNKLLKLVLEKLSKQSLKQLLKLMLYLFAEEDVETTAETCVELLKESLKQFAEQFARTSVETYASIFVKTLTKISSSPLFHHGTHQDNFWRSTVIASILSPGINIVIRQKAWFFHFMSNILVTCQYSSIQKMARVCMMSSTPLIPTIKWKYETVRFGRHVTLFDDLIMKWTYRMLTYLPLSRVCSTFCWGEGKIGTHFHNHAI